METRLLYESLLVLVYRLVYVDFLPQIMKGNLGYIFLIFEILLVFEDCVEISIPLSETIIVHNRCFKIINESSYLKVPNLVQFETGESDSNAYRKKLLETLINHSNYIPEIPITVLCVFEYINDSSLSSKKDQLLNNKPEEELIVGSLKVSSSAFITRVTSEGSMRRMRLVLLAPFADIESADINVLFKCYSMLISNTKGKAFESVNPKNILTSKLEEMGKPFVKVIWNEIKGMEDLFYLLHKSFNSIRCVLNDDYTMTLNRLTRISKLKYFKLKPIEDKFLRFLIFVDLLCFMKDQNSLIEEFITDDSVNRDIGNNCCRAGKEIINYSLIRFIERRGEVLRFNLWDDRILSTDFEESDSIQLIDEICKFKKRCLALIFELIEK
ncbi:hypothetical protein O9G_002199 [Rozella allomycis CSF55]|uniref:Uncharacterized protein n=1 Tax=Rozella allomycis (strain CSF55) TaxID=988480 RepID=A0A075AUY1_ROZAC|nr:hypothetical protein O9G_002199 [Rozella allomycis CSF55]|eukprot:EPZ32359.1 hypothetical protein O9G_002199 [Rozella allomycis CSF55]